MIPQDLPQVPDRNFWLNGRSWSQGQEACTTKQPWSRWGPVDHCLMMDLQASRLQMTIPVRTKGWGLAITDNCSHLRLSPSSKALLFLEFQVTSGLWAGEEWRMEKKSLWIVWVSGVRHCKSLPEDISILYKFVPPSWRTTDTIHHWFIRRTLSA